MELLLGIDAGTTVTKSVLFDLTGREVGQGAQRVPLSYPLARHVERDQDAVWDSVVQTVRAALSSAGARAGDVVAVGVTSHGDGVYLVDAAGRPTRPGIMSLDTRAREIAASWNGSAVGPRALELTGQLPWASAPAALLAWLLQHEPEVVAASRWALPAKDMLRLRLTGLAATEPTEASLSFTNVRTQTYDDAILDLFGLDSVADMRPPVVACTDAPSGLTEESADALGLRPGTPVAGSAHDVDCGALGTGVIAPGTLSVIAGSFNINQAVSTEPVMDPEWCARNFVLPGSWNNMAISPTSATNLEWFANQLCAVDLKVGREAGDPFAFVDREVAAVAADPIDVVYLPFLYGSPSGEDASGTFVGLHGWHTRGHILRAIQQGVAFTHRWHVDALDRSFPTSAVRLTGGATRSPLWTQIYADVLNRPVEVTATEQASALGVSLLAGVAAGVWRNVQQAADDTVRVRDIYRPGPHAAELDVAYQRFRGLIHALAPWWTHGVSKEPTV